MSFEPEDDFEILANPELIDESPTVDAQSVGAAELQASYLHPSSMVFSLIAQLRQNVVPAVIGIFGAAKGSYVFLGIAALIFVLSIIVSAFRYFTLQYSIQDGELTVQSGLLFRRLRKVPTSQIQNIDLIQNVLHRMMRVAEVRVETASGTEPEATLRVLSLAQVEQLRAKVKSARNVTTAASSPTTDHSPAENAAIENAHEETESEKILSISTTQLVKAGLASNRGMVLIGFVIGFYLQNRPEEGLEQQFRELYGYLPIAGTGWQFWISMTAAAIVGLVLVRFLGVGWFILRFFGYRLTRVGADFKISCGLFTKVSATVPIRRIQFISVHRSWTMRLLGLASIRIETAGGSASGQENASTTVSKRWFIPVVPESRVKEMMSIVRPTLAWDETSFDWKPLAPRATARMVRVGVVFSIFVAVAGVAASRPWGWVPGVVLSPLVIWYQIRKSRSTRYARIAEGIVFRSGVLTKKTSVTFFEKIQATSFAQSPFDRRWGMGTLSVDTAASGPANHTIEIPYLDQHFAQDEYEKVLRLSSAS